MIRRILKKLLRRLELPEVRINEIAPMAIPISGAILDDVCMPPHYNNGWFLQNDFGVLLRLVAFLKPQLVFEFGTAHGNTTANICHLTNARVFTLNALPDQITGEIVTFALSQEEIGRVYKKHGFGDRVTQIYENSLRFRPEEFLKPNSVDLCIVDACHDTDFVINDFTTIAPFIAKNGVVLLHDTHPSREGHLKGSYEACLHLRRQGYNILHIEDSWWGYWRKPAHE